MSWGPRARANYRCRKMAGRAAMRAYRKNNGGVSSEPRYAPVARPISAARPVPNPACTLQPPSSPAPLAIEAEFIRDQRYCTGSLAVFIATLTPVLFVLLFVPMTPVLAVFCTLLGILLVPEGAICLIYKAQLKASERRLGADQQSNPEKYAAQKASQDLAERLWVDYLARQDQSFEKLEQPEELRQSGKLEQSAAPHVTPLAPHVAPTLPPRGPSLPPGFKSAQQKQDEEAAWLRQEMRWRSDAKQGRIATEEERIKWAQHQEEKNQRERETAQRNNRIIQEKALVKQEEENEKRENAALSAEIQQLWTQRKLG